jgi:hypothetical protein
VRARRNKEKRGRGGGGITFSSSFCQLPLVSAALASYLEPKGETHDDDDHRGKEGGRGERPQQGPRQPFSISSNGNADRTHPSPDHEPWHRQRDRERGRERETQIRVGETRERRAIRTEERQ